MVATAAPSTDDKHAGVTDKELVALLDEEIGGGICFDNDDKKDSRDRGLDYYDGVMNDLPSEDGRSSVVSRDVADVIDTMMPGLMRVFAGADKVAVYAPARPGDEAFAAQATDYINHVWENDCNGYLVLLTWIMDALQVRNGVVKAYWDTTPEYETSDHTGLSAEQVTMLLSDPEVEILGGAERTEMLPSMLNGQMVPTPVYDLKLQHVVSNGRLVVDNVPPDDFGLSRGAKSIKTARCAWDRARLTRSDLIKAGYPRDIIDDLPAYDPGPRATADRDDDKRPSGTAADQGATAEIEVTEAYILADCDGDGIAEMRKVVTAGGQGGREILSNEPWNDERPYFDMPMQPVPHRWMGRSVFDNVGDLQRIKTALMRAALDNTYAQNLPDREVVEKAIINPDEVMSRKFGNTIRVKEAGAVRDIVVPFVAANTLQAINYIDTVMQRRTGVSQATASLDATAIDPQTATAEQIQHDASYARVELIARNMAQLGLKRLFSGLLRIIVRNQDRPRTIRLRDQWVEFDPRDWNAAMDVSVNVGLGTGSRERDLAMLGGVAARQEQVVKELGIKNPIVTPSMLVATYHKMVEASGLKDADQYFRPVSDEDFARWQQEQAAQNPPQPDPKVQAVEARAKADEQRAQMKAEGDRQRLEADIALDRERSAAEVQNHRDKLEAELQMQRERLEAEAAMKRAELERDFALRRTEMENEAQLRALEMATGHQGVSSNLPRV